MEISDPVFADAIAAIDAGDDRALEGLLSLHPRLLTDRVLNREHAYFADPYLLWFIALNPIRTDAPPPNLLATANLILDHLDRLAPASRPHQLDETVVLVATGRLAREAGLQDALIDTLITRGARPSGLDAAVAHNELAAARRLIGHGAPITLIAALCLGLETDHERLLADAGAQERTDALSVAAPLGLEEAVRRLLASGVDPNVRSSRFHTHATALHLAAGAGHGALCQMLIEAGALSGARDAIWNATPAGWAEHAGHPALAARLRGLINPNGT